VTASLLLASFSGLAQTACALSSTITTVHQEGLAEPAGNIILTCSGGAAGSLVSLQLFVTTNANITNRLDANGNPTGITVTGASLGSLSLSSPTLLTLSNVSYMAASSPTTITIAGLRVAPALLAGGSTLSEITASLLVIGVPPPVNTLVYLAMGKPTLLASVLNNGVPCGGSALPPTLDFPTFASTSLSSAVRITEATAGAFTPKTAGADTGLRILVNITGYGSAASVYVPDAIVGNDGTQPTSAGAFATSVFAGTYTPGGSGQLLLIRVNGADANGAGGTLAFSQPAAVTTFGSMTQVPLTSGNGSVAYEVVDSNPGLQESAQIPVFVVVPQTNCPSTLTPALSVELAPVSTVTTATMTDPIPRFVAVTPASDCTVHDDCTAFYFPQFTVSTNPITLMGSSLGAAQSALVKTGNPGEGLVYFTTSIAYQSGSGWLSVSPSSGSNPVTLQVIANPIALQPGTYTATLTVSAGAYGSFNIPVTFIVGAVGVTIQNVGNAASFTYGTVAPGSYAVLYGLNLLNATVTFNGLPATIVYNSATQINLIVPAALSGQQGAAVVAMVNGLVSNSFIVALALNAPGVFNPGIVNSDGTVNSAANPATRGSYVSIYLTGLSIIGGNTTGPVTVNFGTLTNQTTLFAGAQPTLPALDQVNVTVPASLTLTPNPVQVQVCIPGSTGQQVCSNQVPLYIQ
jgi:uncharacterized protein (TIGR03437 family)